MPSKRHVTSRLGAMIHAKFVVMKHDPQSPSPHLLAASDSVGTWRRFGSIGPVYQILGRGGPLADSDQLIRIRVLESGEELDYPLADILKDPLEH